MKKSVALLVLAACATSGCLWVLEKSQPETDSVPRDPERVARGKYLAENVANCFACHPAGEVATGSHHFGPESGFPAEVWAPNLSPDTDTGIGNWTDGQIMRAIREGVNRDHEAIVPVHPAHDYRALADADVKAIVAYLRARPAARLAVPQRRIDPIYGLFLNAVPRPVGKVPPPDRQDKVKYGKYLAQIASCGSCHAPKGPDGLKPDSWYTSPDITDRGVGKWTDQQLEAAIVRGVKPDGTAFRGGAHPPGFEGLTRADLEALIAFLRTLRPPGDKPPAEGGIDIP
ncbi:MAG: cytochrome c [Candidatus Sericytochromatia bacterium]|nr:cytochrome c [Candidatus Tanganyikabacteria bacterium]